MTKTSALTAALVLAFASGSATAATFTPGSAGLGDPFFPLAGNLATTSATTT